MIPACEMLMTVQVYVEPKEFEEASSRWNLEVEARADSDLLETVTGFGAPHFLWGKGLVGLALDSPPPRDASALIGMVENLPADELFLYVLGRQTARTQEWVDVIERAAIGDEEAMVRCCGSDMDAVRDLKRLHEMGAEALKDRLAAILNGWYEQVYAKEEGAFLQVLERDAQAKIELRPKVSPDRLIEVATGGVAYVPETGIEQVLLVPSVTIRPWVIVTEHRGAKVFIYPVAEASLGNEEGTPPEHLVQMYKALGDESRLRILRVLAGGERQLTEIAEQLGVAKSTAHHHLARLRVAGLVQVTTGAEKTYRLRTDVIPEVSGLLSGYLGTS